MALRHSLVLYRKSPSQRPVDLACCHHLRAHQPTFSCLRVALRAAGLGRAGAAKGQSQGGLRDCTRTLAKSA